MVLWLTPWGTARAQTLPTLSIDSPSVTEGDSGTTTLTYTVSLSPASTVTVTYADAGTGTATAGSDYNTLTSGTLTFAPGETSKTIDVAVRGDIIDEWDETIIVQLSNPTNATIATATGTGTITDNDPLSRIIMGDLRFPEGTNTCCSLYSIALYFRQDTRESGKRITVSYEDAGTGTATSGTDYTTIDPGTITIEPGNVTGATHHVFRVITDAVEEEDETIVLRAFNPVNAILVRDSATYTILNDDPVINITDASAIEGSPVEFEVTLLGTPRQQTTVDYAISIAASDTAEAADFTTTSGTLTFAANTPTLTQTVTVPTTDDNLVEGHETFTATLSNRNYGDLGLWKATATGTIRDNDSATVTIDDASAEEGDRLTFTVTLDKAVSGGLTVTPTYTNVSTNNADYTPNRVALTFAGTANETQTFTVATTEDTRVEANETFTVGLTVSGTTATVTATDTGTGTIRNDDRAPPPTPTLTIDDASAEEGDRLTFTVTLSAAVSGGLTVTPTYTNVSTNNADYTRNTSALTFAGTAGETQTFTVATTEDTRVEGNETFTVGLTVSGTTATVTATDTATGTIRNDDSAAVTVAPTTGLTTTEAGGTATFTVVLTSQPTAAVTIGASSSDPGEGTVSPTSLTFTPSTWSTPQTVTITGVDDAVDDGNQRYTIVLAAAVSTDTTYSGLNPADVTVTNTDDDSAPTPTVTIDDASADEGEDLTFTVTLSAAVSGGLTVTPTYTDGTATSGMDYTRNTGALTFAGTANETQTFTVATTEDTRVEANETFTVGLTVSGTTVTVTATDTATGTIRNDDSAPPPPQTPPAVTIDDVSAEEGEDLTFTVTLSTAVSGGLTVTPTYTDGTATAGTDYTQNTAALTFAGRAGETRTFTVATTEDALVEGDETFTVGLTVSGTTATVTASDTATGTIRNDDSAPPPPPQTPPQTPTPTDDDDSAPSPPQTPPADNDNAAVTVDSPTRLTTTEAGGTADFTVVLDSQPMADVTIKVGCSDPGEGMVSRASLSFTPGTWSTAQTVTITGVDDDVDDGDQRYMIMLAAAVSTDTNYSGLDPDDVAVINMDDDVPADRIVLSVAPASVAEEGGAQSVTVTAAFPQGSARLLTDTIVTLSVTGKTASAEDFAAVADFPVIIPRLAGSGTATFVLTPILDGLMEGDETVRVSGVADGFTVTGTEVTIVDDLRGEKQVMAAVNRAISPQVTQVMAASTVTAVQSRIEAGKACGGQGPSYHVASRQSLAGIMQTVSDGLRDGRLPVERLLGGSSFVLPLNATDDDSKTGWRSLTIWGTGDYRHLGGGKAVDWNGDLFGGHLGVDTCLNADLLVGLTTSVSQGALDYTGLSGATPIGGSHTSRMTSVHPYVNWSSPAGLDLWGTLGYGWGEIAISEQGVPQREASDTMMQTAAVGANGRVLSVAGLLPGGTTRLRLKAEALLTTIKVEGNGRAIEPLALDARRFRLAVEGVHERPLASGARLVPTVELGVRHDGGDGIEGTGLEIGGGLRYEDPTRGLTVAGRGRALVTYGAQEYREWGANLFIRMDPGADGQGLSFTVLPTYGQTASGVSRLWEQGGDRLGPARQDASARLEAVVGYGLPALGGTGLLTPYSAVTLERAGHRLRLGGMLGIGSSFNVSLEGTREVRRETPTVYGVRLQATRRF